MIIVSSLAQVLSRLRLGLFRLVTRLGLAKLMTRLTRSMTRLTRSRTRLVKAKARARSLTIYAKI